MENSWAGGVEETAGGVGVYECKRSIFIYI